MIIFFAFFYTGIVFNPDEQAENLRKYGGFIPGIRPGEKTSIYIDYVLTRLTTVGAIYLALVALLPELLKSMQAKILWLSSCKAAAPTLIRYCTKTSTILRTPSL